MDTPEYQAQVEDPETECIWPYRRNTDDIMDVPTLAAKQEKLAVLYPAELAQRYKLQGIDENQELFTGGSGKKERLPGFGGEIDYNRIGNIVLMNSEQPKSEG